MGRPCVFVRLARCNLRCTWCDTTYSFKGGEKQSVDEIMEIVAQYGCNLVEVTGGEPLLQPEVHDLMKRLCDANYEVMIETSGSLTIEDIDKRVSIIMDLKPPGSGEVEKNLYENIALLKPSDEVKFVILDRIDYDWTKSKMDEYKLTDISEVVLSPVHGDLDAGTLAGWVLEDQLKVRLGLQMHKFLGVE